MDACESVMMQGMTPVELLTDRLLADQSKIQELTLATPKHVNGLVAYKIQSSFKSFKDFFELIAFILTTLADLLLFTIIHALLCLKM